MNHSDEYIRREARESHAEHTATMGQMREFLARLFTADRADGSLAATAKADAAVGALHRRGFLKLGGMTVTAAAMFAACGDGGDATTAQQAVDEAGADGDASQSDITILRTASSLELVAVKVYETVLETGLVTTTAIADAAALFLEQHRDHADLFENATKRLGGEAFAEANPAVMGTLAPALSALTDEPGAVRLAHDLENTAAATYFSTAAAFDDVTLNQVAMSVGGVEARHVAVLAAALGQPPAPRAFWTADGAVAAGTGV